MTVERPQTFGDLLRRLRVEAGLTQEGLAERAGVSVRGVSDLERGRNRYPYRATVLRLIEVLCPADSEVNMLWALATRPHGQPTKTERTSVHTAPQVRLPRPLTALLGRERERAAALHMLRSEGVRLLTVTGTGGVGKTRLALDVAAEMGSDYADGVTFVSLASVTHPALVTSSIATALGMQPAGSETAAETVSRRLADEEHLLVLDNFEHVRSAGTAVADLLSVCPGVKVIVTSRSPLDVRGEYQVDLSPLEIPNAGTISGLDDLAAAPAGALFLERVRAVNPDLRIDEAAARAIAVLCARLDGLPLALELAARQVKYLSPQDLLAQLNGRFEFLDHGARDLPDRQHTLRDTIAWSYRLLSAEEQALFRRLSVFSGGASVDAALAVCDDRQPPGRAVIHALRDASLLTLDPGKPDRGRLDMLATIQEFARELLEAQGELEVFRDRHLAYAVQLAERADPQLRGPQQGEWFARLEDERNNMRSALQWAHEQARRADGLRILAALRYFWEARGSLREARHWLESFLALPSGDTSDGHLVLEMRAMNALGRLCWIQGDLDRGEWVFQQALSRSGGAKASPETLALLNNLAGVAFDRHEFDRAMRIYQEALVLARELDDRWHLAAICTNLGNLASDVGQFDHALTWLEEGLTRSRDLGEVRMMGMNMNVLGEVYRVTGSPVRAAELFREGLRALSGVNDWANLAYSLDCLARVARDEGAHARAARLIGAAVTIQGKIGISTDVAVQRVRDDVVADCEHALGVSQSASAQVAGGLMTVQEAVSYALSHD